MLEITCTGTPYEIGLHYGSQAAKLIKGSVEFYDDYIFRSTKLNWSTVVEIAHKFLPFLEKHAPHLVEELKGISEGSGVPFGSILALNTRTEVSMGMLADGCTTLAYKTADVSVAGQNWDWECAQKARLVLLHIKSATDTPQKPNISVVTEAGLLAKSGINSAGVAVFINAIWARGVNFQALPVHFALRLVLESTDRAQAVSTLKSLGLGTAVHVMVADATGATSIEGSHLDTVLLEMVDGRIAHTNHFLTEHADGVVGVHLFADTTQRMERATKLLGAAQAPAGSSTGTPIIEHILEDDQGFPTSINRKATGKETSETLFSIVADLRAGTARVRLGRPSEDEGIWNLQPAKL